MRLALAGFLLIAVVASFLDRPTLPRSVSMTPAGSSPRLASMPPDTPARRDSANTTPSGNTLASDESTRLVLEITRALTVESDRERALHEWLARLSALDPAAAQRLVMDCPAGPNRTDLLRHLARHWSDHDIGSALDWLATLPASDRMTAAEAMLAQVAQTDPAGALSLAELFCVGLDDGRAERIVQLWTEESPAEAFDWLRHRPAGPTRDLLVARAAWARAQAEPAAAAELVFELMPRDEQRDDALAGVLRHWVVREPAVAARWLHSPQSIGRDASARVPAGR